MLRVYLYGGPGTGKSTTAAAAFAMLKQAGHNVELVREFAKDLTWEGRHATLAYQPYIAAKELWHIERLEGQVDAVITDTSPLLSIVYGGPELSGTFADWLTEEHRRHDTLDVFLARDPGRRYNPRGRNQTEGEAAALDARIRGMLAARVPDAVEVQMGPGAAGEVYRAVAGRLA